MGADKALLEKQGQTQLARTYALLDRHLERVFVSARADQAGDAERSRYAQIVDQFDELGPVAGILSAMAEYPHVDWLVVACDLPNIDDETVTTLLDVHDDRHPFTAYRSTYDALPEPLCAIYGKGAAGIVRGFVEEGIRCPRKMLIRSAARLLEQPNPRALDNVNTPGDLAGSGARIAS